MSLGNSHGDSVPRLLLSAFLQLWNFSMHAFLHHILSFTYVSKNKHILVLRAAHIIVHLYICYNRGCMHALCSPLY